MAKKVKILESPGKTSEFEIIINAYLNKGWKVKGSLIQGYSGFAVLIYKS